MLQEIFKNIPGYEGLYQASNLGNIKSIIKRNGKDIILKACSDSAGYQILTLCKEKKKTTCLVHRLVMMAFLGESDLQVNHKDLNKANNRLDNLEYVTSKENLDHAKANGLLKKNTIEIAEKKRKRIAQVCIKTNQQIAVFESSHQAAKITKINRGNICLSARSKTRNAGNFKWQYI